MKHTDKWKKIQKEEYEFITNSSLEEKKDISIKIYDKKSGDKFVGGFVDEYTNNFILVIEIKDSEKKKVINSYYYLIEKSVERDIINISHLIPIIKYLQRYYICNLGVLK
jgi:hypothetical protein